MSLPDSPKGLAGDAPKRGGGQVSWFGMAIASVPSILAIASLAFYAGAQSTELKATRTIADRNERNIDTVLTVSAGMAATVIEINKAIVKMEKKIDEGVLPAARRAIQEHGRRMDRLENKLDLHRHGGGPSSLEP